MDRNRLFLTVLGAGRSPKAPGTVGSFVALIPAVALLQVLPASSLFLFALLIGAIAVRVIDTYERDTGTHDASEIVIDELVGMWLAIAISHGTPLAIVLDFILFRVFDIWKPSLIGKIDRDVSGGLGVMGDDVLAGILAGICSGGIIMLLGGIL